MLLVKHVTDPAKLTVYPANFLSVNFLIKMNALTHVQMAITMTTLIVRLVMLTALLAMAL